MKSQRALAIYSPGNPATEIKDTGIRKFEFCLYDAVAEKF
jgi:hypothetical protein